MTTTALDIDTQAFLNGYLESALWSSTDHRTDNEDEGTPLDENYSIRDFDPETLTQMTGDCERFISANRSNLELVLGSVAELQDWGSLGHDFWLTRNGHGTGFWARGYGGSEKLQTALKELSDASSAFGEYYLDSNGDGTVGGF